MTNNIAESQIADIWLGFINGIVECTVHTETDETGIKIAINASCLNLEINDSILTAADYFVKRLIKEQKSAVEWLLKKDLIDAYGIGFEMYLSSHGHVDLRNISKPKIISVREGTWKQTMGELEDFCNALPRVHAYISADKKTLLCDSVNLHKNYKEI